MHIPRAFAFLFVRCCFHKQELFFVKRKLRLSTPRLDPAAADPWPWILGYKGLRVLRLEKVTAWEEGGSAFLRRVKLKVAGAWVWHFPRSRKQASGPRPRGLQCGINSSLLNPGRRKGNVALSILLWGVLDSLGSPNGGGLCWSGKCKQ